MKKLRYYVMKCVPSKVYIILRYKKNFRVLPNLKEPKTISEKIQYMNLNKLLFKYSYLVDKYSVREYVKSKIGEKYLVDLLGVYNEPSEIRFDNMPSKYVIKCTHGCQTNIIINDKKSIDIEEIKSKLTKWLKTDYSVNHKELHYKMIKPRIICEENIADINGELKDYKFYCFAGKVKFIQVIAERRASETIQYFYDKDWNPLNLTLGSKIGDDSIKRPNKLEEMISVAEKLAEDFQFVRVDLYYVNNKIKFGELTFTPRGGILKFYPSEYNLELGELIDINKV